ncbi:MAG: hypothetical protein PHW12_03550 [Smithella sp.]|nr:hypothetical protein [Smithella sp.]
MIPTYAYADAGLPMLVFLWPLSLLAIVPVILVESLVVHRKLNVGWKKVIITVTRANLFSTIIGIPVAWLLSVFLEVSFAFLAIKIGGSKSYPPDIVGDVGSVIMAAPWLGSSGHGQWDIPVAIMVLFVPCFFASYLIERWIICEKYTEINREQLSKSVWNANLLSYALLFVLCGFWAVMNTLNNLTLAQSFSLFKLTLEQILF